jgi:GNAT superfamily N-acetyltransferase
VAIRVEQDMRNLLTLHTEHNRYYPNAPIFIPKSTAQPDVLAELAAHAAQGDVVFAYDDQQEPGAYMIVGESSSDGEGFLLQQTKTAQIKSAYARPELRGQGIGTALLQRAVEWAHQQRYARVFVEHETANVYGGQFWGNYFTPYLYASMRYIDPTLSMQG